MDPSLGEISWDGEDAVIYLDASLQRRDVVCSCVAGVAIRRGVWVIPKCQVSTEHTYETRKRAYQEWTSQSGMKPNERRLWIAQRESELEAEVPPEDLRTFSYATVQLPTLKLVLVAD